LRQNRAADDDTKLRLPLRVIVQGFPPELQATIRHPDMEGPEIPFLLDTILPQVARGAVKVPFGDLRQAAPYAFFPQKDLDHLVVTIPLAEILARLDPAIIKRRSAHGKVAVPEDVPTPFDLRCPNPIATAETKPEELSTEPPAAREPACSESLPLATEHRISEAGPDSRSRGPYAHPPQAPAAAPLVPSPVVLPRDLGRPPQELEQLGSPKDIAQPRKGNSVLAASRPPARTEGPVEPATAKPSLRTESPGSQLRIELAAVWEDWPPAVRQEAIQLNIAHAKIRLPLDTVKQGLKRGQLTFNWKSLRSWVESSQVLPIVSAHDRVNLSLPLKTIAPLFLAKQPKSAVKPRLAQDENIPDLFFGSPLPPTDELASSPDQGAVANSIREAPSGRCEAAKVLPSPEQPVAEPSGEVQESRSAPGSDPERTPHQVVFQATALSGVAGALIALPDGLPVASRLPRGLDTDGLAAFVPRIFNQMSNNIKELRMGELTSIQFCVEGIPWQILRLPRAFFVAVGCPNEPLPGDKLAAVTAELAKIE
jgi:predicted regulator of Ras-like GTPase activity (Roadblock/LC7/MglB family)